MKPLTAILVFLLVSAIPIMQSKVHLHMTSNSKATVGMLQEKAPNNTTIISIVEGLTDVYARCQSICLKMHTQVWYSEECNYPNEGRIFRCQCAHQWSSWYSATNRRPVCTALFKGDDLFNYYLNMKGWGEDKCECPGLKNILKMFLSK